MRQQDVKGGILVKCQDRRQLSRTVCRNMRTIETTLNNTVCSFNTYLKLPTIRKSKIMWIFYIKFCIFKL